MQILKKVLSFIFNNFVKLIALTIGLIWLYQNLGL